MPFLQGVLKVQHGRERLRQSSGQSPISLAQATALRSGENEPLKRQGAVKPGKCERAGFTWERVCAWGGGGRGGGVARALLEYYPALLARRT